MEKIRAEAHKCAQAGSPYCHKHTMQTIAFVGADPICQCIV